MQSTSADPAATSTDATIPEPAPAPAPAPFDGDAAAGQPATVSTSAGSSGATAFEVTGTSASRDPLGVLLGTHRHVDATLPSSPTVTTDSSPD